MTRRALAGAALAASLAAAPAPAAAEAELHGFVEGALGVRTAESDVRTEEDWTLRETRAQLRANAWNDAGEAFVRLDLLHDGLADGDTEPELREGWLRVTTLGDRLDLKVGRQALTWGTGDLVFVNDLFPKDWESFFAGREDQYLKAPADAVRLGIFGLPFDVDVVLVPSFEPDRLPAPGGRFSIPAAAAVPVDVPEGELDDAEVAVRLARTVADWEVALYGYSGFYKTPAGFRPPAGPGSVELFHPELSVWGASLRGALAGGVGWLEGGWYDSRLDRDGDDPAVPNPSLRGLAGFERQLATDLNATVQWYAERMLERDAALAAAPPGTDPDDATRHVLTMRIEKLLRYQTVRLSGFGFWSPTDEDGHARLLASVDITDETEIALGANLFEGDAAGTFGRFDDDDNLFVRVRTGF